MKKYFALVICFLVHAGLHAQTFSIEQMRNEYNAGNYAEAKKMADEMIVTPAYSINGEAWNLKGMIDYAFYKQPIELADKDDLLFSAGEAFQNAFKYGDVTTQADVVRQIILVRSSMALKGDLLFNQSKYESAYEFFSGAVANQNFLSENVPSAEFAFDTTLMTSAASTAFIIGNKDEAIKYWEALVSMNYNHPNIYNDLASIYSMDERDAEALSLLETANKKFPDNPAILGSLTAVYMLSNRYPDAAPLADRLATIDRSNPSSQFKAGRVFSMLAQNEALFLPTSFQRAESYFKKAVDLSAEKFDAQFELGYLYYKRALGISEEMDKTADDAQFKKLMSERNGLFGKGIGCFEKANREEPDAVNVLKMLKALYMLTLEYDKAEVIANKLMKIGED